MLSIENAPAALFKDPRDNSTVFLLVPFPEDRALACLEGLSIAASYGARHDGQFHRISLYTGALPHVEEVTDDSPLHDARDGRDLANLRAGSGQAWHVHGEAVQRGLRGTYGGGGMLHIDTDAVELHVPRRATAGPAHRADLNLGRIATDRLAEIFLASLSDDDLSPHWDWFLEHAPESVLDAATGTMEIFGADVAPRVVPSEIAVRLFEHPDPEIRERAIRDLGSLGRRLGR